MQILIVHIAFHFNILQTIPSCCCVNDYSACSVDWFVQQLLSMVIKVVWQQYVHIVFSVDSEALEMICLSHATTENVFIGNSLGVV